ncbi:unnamed protein product [Pleuronectes platessa]|uniref:Uncharacterized protein n=1 Tax=Pleuronectes platessa TaxID=8262 RepID=A0A9N7YQE4_PLEPL|nr:unnamed protein product [Pleuronectes platessa]
MVYMAYKDCHLHGPCRRCPLMEANPAGGAVAPSPSSPRPEAQCAAPGGPHPVAPNGVAGAGAFFLLDRGAVSIAGAEGLWTCVGPFSRITSATATAGGTLRLAPSSCLRTGADQGNPTV